MIYSLALNILKPITLLVIIVVLVVGCTKELLTDELPSEHNSVMLSVSTRAGERNAGSGNESTIKTLRLLVFNSGGAQVANSYYEGASLADLEVGGGKYTVTERLPRDLGPIKVCLIANEPSSWNLGRTTGKVSYVILNNLIIRYDLDFDFIGNNGNNDDLNLYISPDDYFLMYVETAVNFVAGDVSLTEELKLKRTMAKVTLTLGYDRLLDVDYDSGEDFVLKSVSIQNQPIYSHFFAKVYDNDALFSTAYQSLEYDATSKTTQPVVFYIPEYYLSVEAFDSQLFTYIEILGEYTSGGVKIPIVYKIPLGEEVQNIYKDNSYVPIITDYSIVRNHHYIVDGKITKLGEKEGVQAKISIAPWQDGGKVDVDDNAPYLNVSDIALNQIVFSSVPDVSSKIFFWSNQPQNLITLTPISTVYYDSSDLEMNVSGFPSDNLPVIDTNMIKYSTEINADYFFENNGHVVIDVKLPSSIMWSKFVVTFQIQAGNLKRKVALTYITGVIIT